MVKGKKYGILIMISALLIVLAAACSSKTDNAAQSPAPWGEQGTVDKPITLTFFDKNTGDLFTNPVAMEITKRTGITLEIQQPTGDPEEKLNLMLTSNSLPDIVLMDRNSDIVNKYIAANAIIPLNDLIDEYGPNIKEMYGDVLTKSRHTDGSNYYLNNWYGMDTDPLWSFNMRADILKEFGYADKLENGDSFTQEEFIDLLRQFKAKYPEVDGKPSIPLTFHADQSTVIMETFRGMYGMKTYYEQDGNIALDVKHPRYKEMMSFINDLQIEGLLDKEWAINKEQIYEQKASSNRVFVVGGFEPIEPNRLLREQHGEDTDKQYMAFKVTAPGIDPAQTTYGPRSSLGWDAIAITTANKHPEETMKLMDFLASEEGQYLLLWGVENEHWDLVDGKHVPRPEVLQGFKDNWGEYSKRTGIRKWVWFVNNGSGSDGTPYDLVAKYERNKYNEHAIKSMKDSNWDTAIYNNLGPAGGTPDALTEQKLKDLTSQGFTKLAYAETKDEFEQLHTKLLSDLEANKVAQIEQLYTENYKKRLELWK
ncbi:extracellular solute-binding protein [Paenibacillaceae bacterium]|nr:extracellular solute-binding protein [Paenibacillaceae bacterium]